VLRIWRRLFALSLLLAGLPSDGFVLESAPAFAGPTVTSDTATSIDLPYDITAGPDGAFWFTMSLMLQLVRSRRRARSPKTRTPASAARTTSPPCLRILDIHRTTKAEFKSPSFPRTVGVAFREA
jgi:hypothetical protein